MNKKIIMGASFAMLAFGPGYAAPATVSSLDQIPGAPENFTIDQDFILGLLSQSPDGLTITLAAQTGCAAGFGGEGCAPLCGWAAGTKCVDGKFAAARATSCSDLTRGHKLKVEGSGADARNCGQEAMKFTVRVQGGESITCTFDENGGLIKDGGGACAVAAAQPAAGQSITGYTVSK